MSFSLFLAETYIFMALCLTKVSKTVTALAKWVSLLPDHENHSSVATVYV